MLDGLYLSREKDEADMPIINEFIAIVALTATKDSLKDDPSYMVNCDPLRLKKSREERQSRQCWSYASSTQLLTGSSSSYDR